MRSLLLLTLSLLSSTPIFSESDLFIWGKTIDMDTKQPVPNVNIYLSDKSIGTISDTDGKFSISVNETGYHDLEISHIGYSSKKTIISVPMKFGMVIELEDTFFEMEDVVVTGTRTGRIHKNVPVATEVITKKEIREANSMNVAELLSSRSGISIQTSVEGGSVLNILGMDSRYILILIDGQPITGKFNNRVALEQISTGQIKKIEIIKGPSSSLYGSEAMAGVINIISDNMINGNNFEIIAKYSGTEDNTSSNGVQHGSKSLRLSGSKAFENLDVSFNSDIEGIKADKIIQQIDVEDVNKQSLYCNLSFHSFINHKFNLSDMFYNHDEKGASNLMNTSTNIIRNNFVATHNWTLNKSWSLQHSLLHQVYNRKYLQVRPWGEVKTNDMTSENNIEYENIFYNKTHKNELSLGLEISQSSYSSDRVEKGKQIVSTNSIFGQYDVKVTEIFNAILGARLDKYSGYDIVVSPRIGFMYLPIPQWKFRTTWGKGFRTPSFMERFIDWNHIQFGYRVMGNPDLKPEVSNGFTVGIEYYNPSSYQVSLMAYYDKFENLIQDYVIEPATDSTFAHLGYQNIDNAKYKGIELKGRWSISNTWAASWGLNIIDNRDGEGKMIPNTQPFSSHIRISYQHPRSIWNFSLQTKWIGSFKPIEYDPNSGAYISGEKMNDFFIIDGNGKVNILDSLALGLGIKNLLNYTHDRYGPFIGREYYIQLSTTLKGD